MNDLLPRTRFYYKIHNVNLIYFERESVIKWYSLRSFLFIAV
jgi:hypothetical protein